MPSAEREPSREGGVPTVEMLSAPERIIVRVHEELPRDPKRPHFVQTRPVDHAYVRADVAYPIERDEADRDDLDGPWPCIDHGIVNCGDCENR